MAENIYPGLTGTKRRKLHTTKTAKKNDAYVARIMRAVDAAIVDAVTQLLPEGSRTAVSIDVPDGGLLTMADVDGIKLEPSEKFLYAAKIAGRTIGLLSTGKSRFTVIDGLDRTDNLDRAHAATLDGRLD